jgi:hypothetical protein
VLAAFLQKDLSPVVAQLKLVLLLLKRAHPALFNHLQA